MILLEHKGRQDWSKSILGQKLQIPPQAEQPTLTLWAVVYTLDSTYTILEAELFSIDVFTKQVFNGKRFKTQVMVQSSTADMQNRSFTYPGTIECFCSATRNMQHWSSMELYLTRKEAETRLPEVQMLMNSARNKTVAEKLIRDKHKLAGELARVNAELNKLDY